MFQGRKPLHLVALNIVQFEHCSIIGLVAQALPPAFVL